MQISAQLTVSDPSRCTTRKLPIESYNGKKLSVTYENVEDISKSYVRHTCKTHLHSITAFWEKQ